MVRKNKGYPSFFTRDFGLLLFLKIVAIILLYFFFFFWVDRPKVNTKSVSESFFRISPSSKGSLP